MDEPRCTCGVGNGASLLRHSNDCALRSTIFTAEELLLELEQSANTIEFLHGCLTEPKHYKYLYPEMTVERLQRLRLIVPRREYCFHGAPSCPICKDEVARRQAVLAGTEMKLAGIATRRPSKLSFFKRLFTGRIRI